MRIPPDSSKIKGMHFFLPEFFFLFRLQVLEILLQLGREWLKWSTIVPLATLPEIGRQILPEKKWQLIFENYL